MCGYGGWKGVIGAEGEGLVAVGVNKGHIGGSISSCPGLVVVYKVVLSIRVYPVAEVLLSDGSGRRRRIGPRYSIGAMFTPWRTRAGTSAVTAAMIGFRQATLARVRSCRSAGRGRGSFGAGARLT